MGLENFDIAPDNKGGRKKGSGNGTSSASGDDSTFGTRPINLEYETDAITQEKDGEDYWDNVLQKFAPLGDPTDEQIGKMARYAQVRPDEVRLKLYEYDIWECDNVDELIFTPEDSTSSTSFSTSSSSGSSSGGSSGSSAFSSLIDDAS